MSVKLLSNLDFAAKLNSVDAVTESGKEMLNNYKGYMYNHSVSCGLVNGFIQEAQQLSFDTGIMQILSSVLKYVNENKISWKLASACENILSNNSPYGYIAKLGVERVDKLLEMNEPEVIQYIKGGAMKGLNYIPEFRNICREVYQSSISETVHATTYNIEMPVSYVTISEGAQYFSVLGKTYKISEGKVSVEELNDEKFNRVNGLLGNFKVIDEALTYEYKYSYLSDPYKFSITEGNLNFVKGGINENFSDSVAFLQFANQYSKQLFANEAKNFMAIASNIAYVFESAANIVKVDCAKVMTCTDGTVLSIVEADENVNLNVARSLNAGSSNTEYKFMVEALDNVKYLTGNDLRGIYEERINEDCKKADPAAYKSIQEQLQASKNAEIEARKKKISILAEQFKNDPVKIALLNNVARELAILECGDAECKDGECKDKKDVKKKAAKDANDAAADDEDKKDEESDNEENND